MKFNQVNHNNGSVNNTLKGEGPVKATIKYGYESTIELLGMVTLTLIVFFVGGWLTGYIRVNVKNHEETARQGIEINILPESTPEVK